MKGSQPYIAPLELCKYYILSLDMLVSITSTLWLHYFWNTQLCSMIARHDPVLWLSIFFPFHFSCSFSSFSFSSHTEFVIYSSCLPSSCLCFASVLSACICVALILSLSSMHSLFHNLSLFHSLLLFFSLCSFTPTPPTPHPLLHPSFFIFLISLHQHHACHGLKHRKQWSLLNNYHAKQSK